MSTPPLSTDLTLTYNILCLVMISVVNWYKLGNYDFGLGVPRAVLDEIKNNTAYKTEEDKKEALLRYFLKNVPMASWEKVAGALYRMKEKTALEAVKAIMILRPTG